MEISKNSGPEGFIVAIKGRISWREVETFKALLAEVVQGSERKVVLDITEVPFIDSSIIGALVAFHESATRKSVDVSFVVNPTVLQIMFEANLDQVFRIVESRDDLKARPD